MAAITAGELGINHDETDPDNGRSLAFDILNGAGGSLTACLTASQLVAARKFSRALILASEVEPNRVLWPENPCGVREAASAFVLEESGDDTGFTAFGVRNYPEHGDLIHVNTGERGERPAVYHRRDPEADSRILECVAATVEEFLANQSLPLAEVGLVIPPQHPGQWRTRFAETLSVAEEKLLWLPGSEDCFTSSLAFAFDKARRDGRLTSGTTTLVVEVAAGLQVWCALYKS